MLNIKRNIVIISALTLCSESYLAFASRSDLIEPDGNANTIFVSAMPEETIGLIFKKTSKISNPITLTLVCKTWRNILRDNNGIQLDLKFSSLNPFLRSCINTYWEERFKNAKLQYEHIESKTKVVFQFASLKDPFKSVFDLSQCCSANLELVITTDIERFIKKGQENAGKTVIMIALHQMLENEANSSKALFKSTIVGRYATIVPVKILSRFGDDELSEVSSDILISNLTSKGSDDLYGKQLMYFWSWPKVNNNSSWRLIFDELNGAY